MSWNDIYTKQAELDLSNIFEYIAYGLLAPDANTSNFITVKDLIK